MPTENLELNRTEWTILKAVWEREPCTAPVIQEALARKTGWTYSTVRTLMDRMAAKGLLSSERSGKATVFRSSISRRRAQRGELLYALKHAFNGALAPMVQCLLDTGRLSPEELREIEALVKARQKKPDK